MYCVQIHHGTVFEHGYNQYYLYTCIQTCICIHLVYFSSTSLTVPVWWQAAPQTGMPPPILPFQIWQDHDSSAYEHCCCRLLPWTRAQPIGETHGTPMSQDLHTYPRHPWGTCMIIPIHTVMVQQEWQHIEAISQRWKKWIQICSIDYATTGTVQRASNRKSYQRPDTAVSLS